MSQIDKDIEKLKDEVIRKIYQVIRSNCEISKMANGLWLSTKTFADKIMNKIPRYLKRWIRL
ncbi:hypothetical protein [Desulfosporosinus lacus]|uniref:Uncharacterized protein n=1 Tax=Desulfosporosinus lacus DSM 15449 TaxID=1121420 RepID=A0A1M5SDF9_9FIRM|nr:hypothetical protein [Desulfosporosinus lacus]SHH36632.1 hypothetical protein SAMN02746098_00821 [Desulfosporosinus lacus DSM 15449]